MGQNVRKPNFKEEIKLWKKGYRFVIGVDEVGRGAFAGPVVTAAVCFYPTFQKTSTLKERACKPSEIFSKSYRKNLRQENSFTIVSPISCLDRNTIQNRLKPLDPGSEQITDWIANINDSKVLKPRKREKLAKKIKKYCFWAVSEVAVTKINQVGIGKATSRAMRKAIYKMVTRLNCYMVINKNKKKDLNHLTIQPSNHVFVLSDAFHIKYLHGIGLANQKAIKKGDQKSLSIAAASILAKVYRDQLMKKLSRKYSQFGWGRNKGYGTVLHQKAILRYGTTPLHRKKYVQSFLHNRRLVHFQTGKDKLGNQ